LKRNSDLLAPIGKRGDPIEQTLDEKFNSQSADSDVKKYGVDMESLTRAQPLMQELCDQDRGARNGFSASTNGMMNTAVKPAMRMPIFRPE